MTSYHGSTIDSIRQQYPYTPFTGNVTDYFQKNLELCTGLLSIINQERQPKLSSCDTVKGQVDVWRFFDFAKSAMCLDPQKYPNVMRLIEKFQEKNKEYIFCVPPISYDISDIANKYFKCYESTSEGYRETFEVVEPWNHMGLYLLGRKTGQTLQCSPYVSIDAYECVGDVLRSRPIYHLSEEFNGKCEEWREATTVARIIYKPCDNNLTLSDWFFTPLGTPPVPDNITQISESTADAWVWTKLGAGVLGAAYCGYKTVAAVNTLWKATQIKSDEAEKSVVIAAAKRQALLHGIATVAFIMISKL